MKNPLAKFSSASISWLFLDLSLQRYIRQSTAFVIKQQSTYIQTYQFYAAHGFTEVKNHRIQGSEWVDNKNEFSSSDAVDELERVKYNTKLAIDYRGKPEGLDALSKLAKLCQKRIPYNFEGGCNNSICAHNEYISHESVVAAFPVLLDSDTVDAFLEQVREIEANRWLSTNPDSVDGLPSLHLNLISSGKPVADITKNETLNDFQKAIYKLLELVRPQLYDVLLPQVNQLLNSTSISISEVFLRRYGQEICGEVTRNGISAHYDVFSRVTSVIALDDVAATGTNGLYTTYISRTSASSSSPTGSTSNHAALRRFFPLKRGDGVVHTWDVLHGVDVEPGLDRTSLIVWFTDGSEDPSVSPTWLTNHPGLKTNNVAQFVLGSALSSLEGTDDKDSMDEKSRFEHELYLQSAMDGNAFALTRLGSLFEEGSIDKKLQEEARTAIRKLREPSDLPDPIRNVSPDTDIGMAVRCWLEGSLMGNPLAQRALADEIMFLSSQSEDDDGRLLASVLFALAAQQGCAESIDSLSRVVEFDLFSRNVETQEDFLSSPVVMTARAGLS